MLLAASKPTGSWAIGALVPAYVGSPGSTAGGIPGSITNARGVPGDWPTNAAPDSSPFTSRPAPDTSLTPSRFSGETALDVDGASNASPSILQPLSAPIVAAKAQRSRSS